MNDPRLPILLRAQYETLFRVSQVLSRSLDFHKTLREVLRTLEITGHLCGGMVSVVDPEAGDMTVHAVHGLDSEAYEPVRYQSGEGVIGMILEGGRTIAIPRLGDEARFLNRFHQVVQILLGHVDQGFHRLQAAGNGQINFLVQQCLLSDDPLQQSIFIATDMRDYLEIGSFSDLQGAQ